jgi:hypothetical protein
VLKLGFHSRIYSLPAIWWRLTHWKEVLSGDRPQNPRKVTKVLSPKEYYALHGMNAPGAYMSYFLIPFQPFLNMGKDFVDTFKPYKGFYQAKHDLLLPIRGLRNILGGLVGLVFSVVGMAAIILVLLVELIASPLMLLFGMSAREWKDLAKVIFEALGVTASWAAEAAINIVRGLTQIAATPLAWFIKMQLRGIITLFTGAPKIEESKTIKRLAREGQGMLDTENCTVGEVWRIIKSVDAKFTCAVNKGQSTVIDSDDEVQRKIKFLNSILEMGVLVGNEEPMTEARKTLAREYLNQFVSIGPVRNFLMFAEKQKEDFHKRPNALPEDVVNIIGGFFNQAKPSDALEHAARLHALNR